jgi:hypothetical protein
MPGATQQLFNPYGYSVELGVNYVEAMQCWGDPRDPEFYKNCLWGGWSNAPKGLATARPQVFEPNLWRGGSAAVNVPFRASSGREYSSIQQSSTTTTYTVELAEVVQATNTNERAESVDANGHATFLFETQSAASQPYLGCGDPSLAGARCWLVVVPRGSHVSSTADGCAVVPYGGMYGASDATFQQNSPVNPACDYWANRLVLPLDFSPVGAACTAGGVERLVGVAESASAAFSSWQVGLCRSEGTAYSFSSASDEALRGQLLSGQLQMAITARPVTEDYLPSGADSDQIVGARVVYAPVAVTGAAIAFLANEGGVRQTQLRLSPRLLAKMITHSYSREQVLSSYSSLEGMPSGPWSLTEGNPGALTRDPEFQALNPGVFPSFSGTLVMTGPNRADLIEQLWSYLQADDAARAFLAGYPDNVLPGDEENSGMTINPFYLPQGHPDAKVPAFVDGEEWGFKEGSGYDWIPALLLQRSATGEVEWREVGLTADDGTSMCLCDTPAKTFPKSDEALKPRLLNAMNQYRYDIQQELPYAADMGAAARMVFRGDKGSKTAWDAAAGNGAAGGILGAYTASGMARQSSVFLNGFTSVADASAYHLPTVSLQVPNARGVFVDADGGGMAAAVAAQSPSGVSGVTITDPGALPATAYPLTTVLYAAVNLATADEAAREQFADLIEYAVTAGQVAGQDAGQLPEGYVPLPDDLSERALATVQVIRDFQEDDGDPSPLPSPTPTPTPTASRTNPGNNSGNNSGNLPGGAAAPTSTASSGSPGAGADYTAVQAAAAAEVTAAAAPASRSALGGGLVAGAAGMAAGPLLLRRRRAAL